VHQVLVNLLSNAFKFTQAGSIVVGLEAVQGELIFFVEDTGIGIPEMQLPKVFDRFYQVEATGTRRFDGAGLGLSLCKGIVELLGGRIWVISQVGQGSRFCFTVADLPEKS
jgi:signal transduction histidine kinase